MITKGRHTYIGEGPATERFNPVVEIGNFTSIGAGTCFYGMSRHPMTITTFPFADKGWCNECGYPKTYSKGKIVIGNDVWIGEDVKIIDGVIIGDGAVIGAGAVVAKDVQPYAIAVGNPIEVKRYRFTLAQIDALLKIKWWDWPDEKIKEELPYFTDIEKFIERNL